jgi:endonuclease/exonuclease/phosphatase family metal-dependent hydrolase
MKPTRFLLWMTLLGAVTLGACEPGDDAPPANAVPVRVLTYNIGNPNAEDSDYPLRLKHQDYEDYVGAQIRALEPDIVLLQEVLPATHCEALNETDPALTCYDAANSEPPVRRVLGPDYTIVCDERRHVECIGVRVGFGTIAGMEPGGYALSGAPTPDLPMDSCEWAEGTCSNDFCDFESTVSAVDVQTGYGDLRVVHLHPNAGGNGIDGAYTGAPCRALQLEQVFDGLTGHPNTPLVTPSPTILAGDFNMDPVRMTSPDETALWDVHVGSDGRFTDFSPTDDDAVQYSTRRGSFGLAIDHVLADRASGSCTVFGHDDGFGADPGTLPLDDGFDWTQVPDGKWYAGRLDHFAILCDLEIDFTME